MLDRNAAAMLTLPPGNYTALVTKARGTNGVAWSKLTKSLTAAETRTH